MSLSIALRFVLVGACWGCTKEFLQNGASRKIDSGRGSADEDAKKSRLGKLSGPLRGLFSAEDAVMLISRSGTMIYNFLLVIQDFSIAVPVCSALEFVFAAGTAMCLGEKADRPLRRCAGILLVLIGIAVCVASKASAAI